MDGKCKTRIVSAYLLVVVIVSVSGHYYMSDHEFSINRNCKVVRNLIVGERELYDGEITVYDAKEDKRRLLFSTHTFKFRLVGSRITCIFIVNMISYNVPFYVTLVDGGIGKSFIILKLKSGWQSPLWARIILYGYQGRYNITAPTQPLYRGVKSSLQNYSNITQVEDDPA